MGLSICLQFEGTVLEGTRFNCTHNITPMWRKAGCYEALYRSGGKTAKDVLPILIEGLRIMLLSPDEFKQFNPSNGWGSYEGACEFLENVIKSFRENPNATVRVSA